MKRAKLILTAIMSVLFIFGLNAQKITVRYTNHDVNDHRIERQIKKGIRSGELTKKEVRKLKREWQEVEHIKRKAWRNGHLSRRERQRIYHAKEDFDRLLFKFMNNRAHRHNHKYRDYDRYDRWDNDWDDDYDYYYNKKGKKRH